MNFHFPPSMTKPLRRFLRRWGGEIPGVQPRASSQSEPPYRRVRPVATYAPWNADSLFLLTYRKIAANTLVDYYRCYELWTLVEQVAKVEGALLEVGTWRGGTGALIATKAREVGIKETVFLCDTFRGVVKAGEQDGIYRGGEHGDTSAALVEDLLYRELKLTNADVIPGVFPDETGPELESFRFRFCHIDVDVYESAKAVQEWVWQRMPVGAIVVYDDYGWESCPGITRYVDEQRGFSDRVIIHNLNGHAVVVKTHARGAASSSVP